jgi:pSer/pThr/pTyr-binding forkhead associated (FHA) protein
MPKLRVFKNRDHVFNYYIDDLETIIGRSREADVPLNSEAVSRKHLRIRCHGSTYTIENLSNGNAMFVNGRYTDVHILKNGDRIEVPQHLLIFERSNAEVQDEKRDRSHHSQFRVGHQEVEKLFDTKVEAVVEVAAKVQGQDYKGTNMLTPADLASLQAAMAAQRKAHLAFLADGRKQQIELGMTPINIGFNDRCQIRLPGTNLMGQVTARISPIEGGKFALQVVSRPTVFLNGQKILDRELRTLENEDTLSISGIKIRFRTSVG